MKYYIMYQHSNINNNIFLEKNNNNNYIYIVVTCAYIFIFIHIYIYTYLYIYVYIYLFIFVCIYIYIHLYTLLYIYLFIYLHAYIVIQSLAKSEAKPCIPSYKGTDTISRPDTTVVSFWRRWAAFAAWPRCRVLRGLAHPSCFSLVSAVNGGFNQQKHGKKPLYPPVI